VSDSLATDATASTTVPETTDADSSSSIELDALGVVAPGAYTSDVLPLSLDVTTTDSFRLERAHPGMIEIVSLASSPEAYRGVALMVVDTLIDTDAVGRHLSRTAAGSDLDEYLRSRDRMVILDRRTEVLGGLEADVWRVGFTDPCGDCWYPVLFNTTGFRNQWGHPPGYVQEYWSIDAPGAPIIVAVEAPEDSFDAWNEQVHEHFFAGLRFGSPSGYSPALPPVPSGTSLDGFGPHGIGRAELEVVDASRPTSEVSDERGLLVPSSDERRLLLSVAYPSEAGGFGAEPADGSFPLVVVAPALFDASISLPAERQLASHGFVVVTVRFPESSFPGNAVFGVPQQPADVSFVIDEIERGALPADLAAITDVERIGLIGHSGGATTGFGLLAYDCCQDPRIDAIVAHAGTPFDFGSVRLANIAPILHVVSDGDQQISVDAIRAFHEATDGPSTFAVMEGARHLEWLDPQSSQYDATFELVSTFLDQHLRGGQADLGVVADTSVFAEIDQRWNVTAAGSPVRTPTRRSPGRRRRP
jgi:dienelactone hydrolase